MLPTTELTPAQHEVLALLANGSTVTDAALATGVHRNTVANWRATVPAFSRALEIAIQERALSFQDQAASLLPKAFETLSTILHNEAASPSIRLRAALAVIKMATAAPKPEAALTHTPQPLPEAPVDERIQAEVARMQELQAKIHDRLAQQTEILHNPAQQPIRRPVEPGRNSACSCGSGLKYKRCCANAARASQPDKPPASVSSCQV